jgi:hypothetical protein
MAGNLRRKILAGSQPGRPRQRIKYSKESLTDRKEPGSSWEEERDNPMSPLFEPLTSRTEYDKARWWAKLGRKKARASHGEF